MVDYGISGKNAIVCGASSGMGLASAVELARQGVNLLLIARTEEKLEEAKAAVQKKASSDIKTLVGNVCDLELAERSVELAVDSWGSTDILVNNAGGPPPGSFLEKSNDDWESALHQNLISVVRFTKAVAPLMMEQKWGRIVNISSTLAKEPSAPMVLSATARAGVSAFTKSVSYELAPHGVTINTLCPGGVRTDRLENLCKSAAESQGRTLDEVMKESQSTIPLGRFAEPDEFADVLVFLTSERGRYLTGTSIMVDGGLTKSVF